MSLKNKFELGEIVTFKSHPLLYDFYIKGDGKLVPPFMVVTEIDFESKKKKIADEETGHTIAERIKYQCVFFDDNKSQFKYVFVYESMLKNYESIYIARNDEVEEDDSFKSLIDEAKNYKVPEYEFSKIIYFKTKKFEIFKKRSSIKIIKQNSRKNKKNKTKSVIQYVVNYATPDFILTGVKKQNTEDGFYPNGNVKKITSKLLFKVKWFNSSQMKFSEHFLPSECFMAEQPFSSKVPHLKSK